MRAFIVLVLLLAVVPAHAGKYRTITCRGKVGFGTTDSGIYGLTNDCGWLTKSAIGSRIFKVCQVGDECEISGVVDENDWLVRVSRVSKIDIVSEPPTDIIKQAACLALPMSSECYTSMNWSVKIYVLSLSRRIVDECESLKYHANVVVDRSSTGRVVFEGVQFGVVKRNNEWIPEK